jgi:plastocyanin
VTIGITSVIAIGATIIIPLMDEVSFDTDDSESSSTVNTDNRERETTTPLRLTGVKVGDEISYYCMVHPSMTGKLIVTSPTTGQNTITTA